MRQISLIAHNLRSSHNVGSLLRTAEGLGVECVYLTGYTPYPQAANDSRLPHETQRQTKQIHKTALGAEDSIRFEYQPAIESVIRNLHRHGYTVCAVEQGQKAIQLMDFQPPEKVALIVGNEVSGLEPDIVKLADSMIEIPMLGKKESYNVVQAAAMALYHVRFTT